MFLLLQKDWKNAKCCFLFDVSFSLGLLDACVQGPAVLICPQLTNMFSDSQEEQVESRQHLLSHWTHRDPASQKQSKSKRQKGKKAGTNNCCGPRAGSCTAELLIVIFVPNSTTVTQFGNSRHRTISKTQIKTTMNKQTPKAKEANNKQAQCNTKKTAKRIKLNFWDAKRNYGNKQRYRGQKET